jgi:hypothetical protein
MLKDNISTPLWRYPSSTAVLCLLRMTDTLLQIFLLLLYIYKTVS